MKRIIKSIGVVLLSFVVLCVSVFVTPVQAASSKGINEKWLVPGQWEFTITNVQSHSFCNKYSDKKGDQVVIITYKYKHNGYKKGLYFSDYDLKVYDEKGKAASTYICDHEMFAKQLWLEGSYTYASAAYVLPNKSKNITISVNKYDDKYNKKNATYYVPVTNKSPTYTWNNTNLPSASSYNYTLNQTWKVANNWEFKFTNARNHTKCNKYDTTSIGEQVVLLDYFYKNIGYKNSMMGLYMYSGDFEVFDEFGNPATSYSCLDHEVHPSELDLKGTECDASEAFILKKKSKYVIVRVSKYDSNNKVKSAFFMLSINNSPIPKKQSAWVTPTGIKLDKTTETVFKNKTIKLKATVSPSNTLSKTVTWKSSNKKVATVSSDGTVKGISPGKVKITATTTNGYSKTATITVTDKSIIKLNKTSATIGTKNIGKYKNTLQLKASVNPSGAVTWTSSNPKVAKVDSTGKVTGVSDPSNKVSTVTITAKTKDGKTATCKVTVEDPINAFVRRLYKYCFNRDPDKGGFKYWTDGLRSKKMDAAFVVKEFFDSKEMKNMRLSAGATIERCYLVMMDRKSDAGGKKYWEGVYNSKGKLEVLKGFIASNEFTKICKDFNIVKGTIK